VSSKPPQLKQVSTETTDPAQELKPKKKKKKDKEAAGGRGGLKYDASFKFKCDWKAAINFEPGLHGTFGYLLVWSGCGIELTPALTLANPFGSPEAQTAPVVSLDDDKNPVLTCIGVIEDFEYEGGPTDPIYISAFVTRKAAVTLHGAFSPTEDDPPPTDVEVAWYIIDCEGAGEPWYEAAHIKGFSNAVANVATDEIPGESGGEMKVSISREGTGVTGDDGEIDIRLYEFKFEIIPASGQVTTLNFAQGPALNIVRPWGKSQ
jgi:hypothetical protein